MPQPARHTLAIARAGARLVLVAALLASAIGPQHAWANPKPEPKAGGVDAIKVTARRLSAFAPGAPERRTFGALEFRGGLVLSAADRNFGGWSGLTIDPDGRRILAVSDGGAWMTAEIAYQGLRPAAIENARLGPILALGGRDLTRSRDRDAESVRLISGNLARGTVLIAFEQNARIGRFAIGPDGLAPPSNYLSRNPEWRSVTANKSLESVAYIDAGPMKGSVVTFAEKKTIGGNDTGWIWVRGLAGKSQRLQVRRIGKFELTDAAALPDGSLILLERSFSWTEGVRMRMRQIAAQDVRPGRMLDGRVLIEASMAYEIDNMEGLAIHTGPRGEPVLTLISDDNFNRFLQRTLLLQFALPPARQSAQSR